MNGRWRRRRRREICISSSAFGKDSYSSLFILMVFGIALGLGLAELGRFGQWLDIVGHRIRFGVFRFLIFFLGFLLFRFIIVVVGGRGRGDGC